MQSNPATKPQVARRRKPVNVPLRDYRSELQNALKVSPPGGHLNAVIALYICDPIKLKKTCDQIRRCIKSGLKDKVIVEVSAFGSLVTDLALQDSDLDLYVREYNDPSMSQSQLYAVLMDFLTTCWRFLDVAKVPRTREPIIRCKHRLSKLNLNIHVSHPNGAYNSEFIGNLMRRSKIVRDLSLFLKIWSNNLIESCRMSNYCLICMIIVSLQEQGLLLSVKQLQAGCPPNIFRGINYACTLFKMRPIPEEITVLELIEDFFELYSTTDFENQAVSPFFGCVMKKQPFRDDEITEYTAQLEAMKAAGAEPPSPFRLITCMYVQDPFDMHSNVAQSVSPLSLSWIKKCFSLASRATKDPKLRAQPEKLYEYLLFGMTDELEEMQEEEERAMRAQKKRMKQMKEDLAELEEEEIAELEEEERAQQDETEPKREKECKNGKEKKSKNKRESKHKKEPTLQKEKGLTKQAKKKPGGSSNKLMKQENEEPCCSTNKFMKQKEKKLINQEKEEPFDILNEMRKMSEIEIRKRKEKEITKKEENGPMKREKEEPCCSTNKLMNQKDTELKKQEKEEPSSILYWMQKMKKIEIEIELRKQREKELVKQKEKELTKQEEKKPTKRKKEEPCCSANKLMKQEKEEQKEKELV